MTNPVLISIFAKVRCFSISLHLAWTGGWYRRDLPCRPTSQVGIGEGYTDENRIVKRPMILCRGSISANYGVSTERNKETSPWLQ